MRTEVSILNFSITDLKRHETFIYREKRERELEGFMNKKYNRLGNKIQQRINNMNSLKTNRDLVLEWRSAETIEWYNITYLWYLYIFIITRIVVKIC